MTVSATRDGASPIAPEEEGRPRILASRRYGTVSPLRYPGGKAALAGLFADVLGGLGLCGVRYVEPYAGGAGAGVALLRQDLVGHLVINDIDPAVHAFWRAVTEQNQEFLELVQTVPLPSRISYHENASTFVGAFSCLPEGLTLRRQGSG